MNKNNGFTLIEVLIAMIVLAIGLLGLAGLQATSLNNNQSAYNRSQATQLAYDLADRIRANVAEATATPSAYTTIPPAAAVRQADCLTVSITCKTAVMAENDLYEWNLAVTTTLPSGAGTITVIPGPPAVFTITINWDDDKSGAASRQFVTRFQL